MDVWNEGLRRPRLFLTATWNSDTFNSAPLFFSFSFSHGLRTRRRGPTTEKTTYIHRARDVRGSETGVVARSESYVSSDDQPKASLRWLRGRASRPDEAHAGRRRQRRSLLIPRRRPGEGGGRPHPGRHPPSGETSGRRTVRTHFAPSPLCTSRRPSHSPSRALLARRSSETGSSSSKRTTLRATRP